MSNNKNTDAIELDGTVTEVLGNGKYKVQIPDTDHIVLCHMSGRMRQANIRVILGDMVKLVVSPLDITNGRIVYRVRK